MHPDSINLFETLRCSRISSCNPLFTAPAVCQHESYTHLKILVAYWEFESQFQDLKSCELTPIRIGHEYNLVGSVLTRKIHCLNLSSCRVIVDRSCTYDLQLECWCSPSSELQLSSSSNFNFWQGWSASNRLHSVLETDVLPV